MARAESPLSISKRAQTLVGLKLAREACIDVRAAVPPGSDEYEAACAVISAIDDFAHVLTGDRQHFWRKPGSAHVPCARCHGAAWVCVAHPYTPYPHQSCGADEGEACPVCNTGQPPRPPTDFIS